LVGVQPVLTQVPPKNFRSMTATFQSAATSRRAKAGPACPVPMMIASYPAIADLSFLSGRHTKSECRRG
jgi:hypothetical protein